MGTAPGESDGNGIAMAIQENGIESLDYFAMLRGWGLARPSAGSGTV